MMDAKNMTEVFLNLDIQLRNLGINGPVRVRVPKTVWFELVGEMKRWGTCTSTMTLGLVTIVPDEATTDELVARGMGNTQVHVVHHSTQWGPPDEKP